MPIIKGVKAKSKAGFGQNVATEMKAGKPQKQAVAIAYRAAGSPPKKKMSHVSPKRIAAHVKKPSRG